MANIAIARQITSDIKWLLSNAGLYHNPNCRVTTTAVKGGCYETVVFGVDAAAAQEALAERARNIPGTTFDRRVYDGALIVRQPL